MINFFTDNYFHIGGAHLTGGKPCQDYAISDVCDQAAFAIVSDGCSTGRHTDVGSRLLTLSTASAIRNHWSVHRRIDVVETSSLISVQQNVLLTGMRDTLGLIPEDLLATCVYAYVSSDGGIVHVQGDGVVVIKYRDGRIAMRNFEWLNNMPFYPMYKNGNLNRFINAHGGDLKKRCLQEENIIMSDDGNIISSDLKEYSLSSGINGVTINISCDDLENEIEFITVFSDGVTQIDGVDWREAVKMFMAFKNTKGEFLKRRMIRGIKDSQKVGKGPFDDVSCAVIHVVRTEEETENND